MKSFAAITATTAKRGVLLSLSSILNSRRSDDALTTSGHTPPPPALLSPIANRTKQRTLAVKRNDAVNKKEENDDDEETKDTEFKKPYRTMRQKRKRRAKSSENGSDDDDDEEENGASDTENDPKSDDEENEEDGNAAKKAKGTMRSRRRPLKKRTTNTGKTVSSAKLQPIKPGYCGVRGCSMMAQKRWMGTGAFCVNHGRYLCANEWCSEPFDLPISSPKPHLCVSCRDSTLNDVQSWYEKGLRITLSEHASKHAVYSPHQLHDAVAPQRGSNAIASLRSEIRKRGYRKTIPLPSNQNVPVTVLTRRPSVKHNEMDIINRKIAAVNHRTTDFDAKQSALLPAVAPLSYNQTILPGHKIDYSIPNYYQMRLSLPLEPPRVLSPPMTLVTQHPRPKPKRLSTTPAVQMLRPVPVPPTPLPPLPAPPPSPSPSLSLALPFSEPVPATSLTIRRPPIRTNKDKSVTHASAGMTYEDYARLTATLFSLRS